MRTGQPFCPKNRFSGMWLPMWLVRMEITWAAKAVYARAANLADSSGWCSFKVQWMAGELGVDVSTVKRSLATLSDSGLILVARVTGRARLAHEGNRYRFIWHPVMADLATGQNEPSDERAGEPSEERAGAPSSTKKDEEDLGDNTPPTPPRGGEVIGFGSARVGIDALRRVPSGRRAAVLSVFAAWCESPTAMDKPRRDAKLDGIVGRGRTKRNRADFIDDRLREGWPVDDLRDAVRGWVHSPHHRGENDGGIVYSDLTLLLRDAANIEKFRDLWRAHPESEQSEAERAASRARGEERERALVAADLDRFYRDNPDLKREAS